MKAQCIGAADGKGDAFVPELRQDMTVERAGFAIEHMSEVSKTHALGHVLCPSATGSTEQNRAVAPGRARAQQNREQTRGSGEKEGDPSRSRWRSSLHEGLAGAL